MSRGRARQAETVKRGKGWVWGGLLLVGAVAAALMLASRSAQRAPEEVTPVLIAADDAAQRPSRPTVEQLAVRVVRTYPHAADAFTQGLLWSNGRLYESTGRYGRSSLRKIRLDDGRIIAQRDLDPNVFAEGLALVGDRLIQLTWREGVAIVSDLESFRERERLSYAGEGWGLCFDGRALIMSDGSSMLELRNPDTMELLGEMSVLRDGHPVPRLNELECVGSDIYANVWQRDEILRIDAKTGTVTGSIDASGLLSREEARAADVLNGIAYRPETNTFLLTGKLWPHVFEVELVPR